ncbi:MAG: S-layer protein [Methanomicrobiales archaeon]|nr:S-layer protein [Methanomicrobiales archaeon]NYT20295.1 S-layer protein [Methanomicrobiales archaeon]
MKIAHFGILVILIGLLMVPVQAGTKYMSGGPELTASIAGSNEISPGEDATIRVNVENKGLIDIKFVQSGIVDRDDLPNTAKLVRVSLGTGDAPVTIKSDPQMIGDIKGGTHVQVPFTVKVKANAEAGSYILPLTLEYTYLREAEQYGQDSIIYTYKEVNETIGLPVVIKPEAFLEIADLGAEHLNAGNEGYLTLGVRNAGFVDAGSAILKISRNGNSPVIPTDSSVFIGDFPVNGTVETRFKVSVSREAGEQSYPLDVFLVYEDDAGDTVTSDVVTIGVPVQGKIEFAVTSIPGPLRAGEKTVIEVEYQNTGAATAYSAQARISAVDPFTSNDDTAYLGDLAPGERAIARYEVSVDGSATPKEYGLDSEIRYRDALDNSQISDSMKVPVIIEQASSILPIIAVIVLVLAGSGAAYYFMGRKKKS